MPSLITFGFLSVGYGVVIYYALPLGLLAHNFSLILQIFFMILMGMILGLSILAFNLQSVTEISLTYILLCWEK